ncbi:MAG: protein-tyrosine-phosphatase [Flavobacteriaceae bacterium]
MNTTLNQLVEKLSMAHIVPKRKEELAILIEYIKTQKAQYKTLHLNFICTHNSRRSQFSQLWAKVMAQYHGINCNTYSGGVEVTACNERVIKTLLSQGFDIKTKENGDNPCYQISMEGEYFGEYFSKLYDDPSNPTKNFAAVMTCAHAEENCPFISGAEQRIPVRYKDPKAFDDTPEEKAAYYNKSIEIATEMHYIFSSIA